MITNNYDLKITLSNKNEFEEINDKNIELINESDCLVANLTPFRGPSADPGTCFELGYAIAQKKPVAIYSFDTKEYKQKLKDMSFMEDQWSIEDMGLSDNLMLIAPTNNITPVHGID